MPSLWKHFLRFNKSLASSDQQMGDRHLISSQNLYLKNTITNLEKHNGA